MFLYVNNRYVDKSNKAKVIWQFGDVVKIEVPDDCEDFSDYIECDDEYKIEYIEEQYKNNMLNSIDTKTTQLVKNLLDELDYDNEGEVALYAGNENSRWYKEAKALQAYIETIYIKMYELQDGVRNGEDIKLETIKDNYPKFEIEE